MHQVPREINLAGGRGNNPPSKAGGNSKGTSSSKGGSKK